MSGARASKPARLRELVRFLARRSRAPVVTKLALALLATLIAASAWWWLTAREKTAVRSAIPTGAAAQDGRSSARDASPPEDALNAGSESRVEVGPRSTDLARIDLRVVGPDSTAIARHPIAAVTPGDDPDRDGILVDGAPTQLRQFERTDERGEVTLYVEPFKPVAIFSLASRGPETRVVLDGLGVADRRTVTLTLPTEEAAPDRQVHVRVLDFVTRAPLAGAKLVASARGPVLARSDERGEFSAVLRSWRGGDRYVARAGFAPSKVDFGPGRGGGDAPLVVLMVRAMALDVNVVDASGAPIEALIRARVDDPAIAGETEFLIRSEWDAKLGPGELAHLTQLPADVDIELQACSRLELGVTVRVHMPARETAYPITLRLPPAGTILGQVTGLPSAADLEVELQHADKQAAWFGPKASWIANPFVSTRTDSDGRFRIANVPAGDWKLSVEQPEGALALAAVRVNVSPGGGEYAVVLAAETGAWLRGVVRMCDGAMEPTNISAERVDGLAVGEGRVSASGEFELGPLPGGEYVVRVGGWVDVASPHIRLFEGKLFRLAPAARVTTRLEPGVQDLELELEPVRGVGVELVDTQDLPVLGTVVFATGGEAVAVSTGTSNIARFAMRTADRVLTVHAWSYDRRLTAERTFHIDGEQADAPLRLVLAPQPLPPASKAPPRLTK